MTVTMVRYKIHDVHLQLTNQKIRCGMINNRMNYVALIPAGVSLLWYDSHCYVPRTLKLVFFLGHTLFETCILSWVKGFGMTKTHCKA